MRKFCKEISLAFVNPELAKEWDYEKKHPLTPEDVFSSGRKKVWWKCNKCKQSYESKIDNRSKGSGCPYCAGRKVYGGNSLATLNPEASMEWHPTKNGELTPSNVILKSTKEAYWICKEGHEYKCRIIDKAFRNRNCLVCHSLGTKDKALAKEWHPTKNGKLTPFDFKPFTNKRVWWLCSRCGKEYIAKISHRVLGTGCFRCNRVELKDGTICDSLTEAYYYLKLKEQKVEFKCQVEIGLGRHSCDFYIPNLNKYVEVTGYSKQWKHWEKYNKNILKKKKHITKELKADFELVQLKLTLKQKRYVKGKSV